MANDHRRRPAAQPRLEGLEDRTLQTVTAGVNWGNLSVRASGQASIEIVQTASRSFAVYDHQQLVSHVSGVTGGIRVDLSGQDDRVAISLAGLDLVGNLEINGNGGNDEVVIGHGLIRGQLRINGGPGEDRVSLGDFDGALEVAGPVRIDGNGGSANGLLVGSNVRFRQTATLRNLNDVRLAPGSIVDGRLDTMVRRGSLLLAMGGTVVQPSQITGAGGNDRVEIGESADIGMVTAHLGGGNDAFVTAGRLDQAVISTGDGDDEAVVAGWVNGPLTVTMGRGLDAMALQATVGDASRPSDSAMQVTMGTGMDVVTVMPDFDLRGLGSIDLGANGDTFRLVSRATASPVRVDGSGGINTFSGQRDGLTHPPLRFQVFTE